MVLLFDAWGGNWGSDEGGAAQTNSWAQTWTYDVNLQPKTSAGVGGQAAKSHPTRRRFFDYPNIIDDPLLRYLPPSPIVKPRPTKRAAPSIEEIDEDDPIIQRMQQAMERRTHADEPPPGDADLKRIYGWLQKRKQ